jgi:signal transduction histidine kinase
MVSDNDQQRAALIGRIAAGLAHDINGPVGVIIGFADLARETLRSAQDGRVDADSAKRVLEYVDLISDAAVRARTLTRGVWTFARNRPGPAGPVDLARAVRMSAALAMPELRGARIETAATESDLVPPDAGAPPLGPVAHGDLTLCTQGLVSLLLAAPHALPSGGTVTWEVRSSGREVNVVLAGRPYESDGRVADWPAPAMARAAFEQQGGRLNEPGGPSVIGVLPAAVDHGDVRSAGEARGRPEAKRPRG